MALGFYRVRSENLAVAQDAIDNLNKRAARNGLAPITIRVLDTERREWRPSPNEAPQVLTWVHVSVEGTAPKLGDWQFAASLEHTDAGTLLRTLPGFDLPLPEQYRTASAWCDHCQSHRRRRDTYVVYSASEGRFAQVGSECLKDYTGHANPQVVVSWLQSFYLAERTIREASEEEGGSYRRSDMYSVQTVLAAAAACVSKWGYVSKAEAVNRNLAATSSWVATILAGSTQTLTIDWTETAIILTSLDRFGRPQERTELPLDTELAARSLEHALALTGASDFEYNVRTACTLPAVTDRHIGFIAAAVASYLRSKPQVQEATAEPAYIGEVGKRIELDVRVERVVALGAGYTYNSPDRALYILSQGVNRLAWFSEAGKLAEGRTYRLKATIKAHDLYKGAPQTVVTRAAIC